MCLFNAVYYISHAVQNVLGAIGEVVYVFFLGNSRKYQHGIDIGFDTCDNVGIHSVTDKGYIGTVTAKNAETVAKHKGVRLAYEISYS